MTEVAQLKLSLNKTIGHLPSEVVADAGYGSEQNYAWLEGQGCDAYVKHGEFFR